MTTDNILLPFSSRNFALVNGGPIGSRAEMNADSKGTNMIKPNRSKTLTARPRVGCSIPLFLLAGFLAASAQAQTLTVLKNLEPYSYSPNGSLVQGPDGTLYGTASSGTNGFGLVYKVQPNGTGLAVLKSFSGSDGAGPAAGLILSGNTLYGTTEGGGSLGGGWLGVGTVFKINTDGSGFSVLHNFTSFKDGGQPECILALSGNTLYGTAFEGGNFGYGTVFAVNTDGTGFTNLHSFTAGTDNGNGAYTNSDGEQPVCGLVISGNALYGTALGGRSGSGTVFAVNTDGSGFTNLYNFTATSVDPSGTPTNSDGNYPTEIILSGNTLYGTTGYGGVSGQGTVFAVNTDGSGFTVLRNFTVSDGRTGGKLILSGGTLYGAAGSGGSFSSGTVFAVNTDGSGFTNLYSFTATSVDPSGTPTNSDGDWPYGGLLLSGNTLYGTARAGGLGNNGTIFKIKTSGSGFTVLDNFGGEIGGCNPYAGLLLLGNTLYGTTSGGGSTGPGTVFKINTDGSGYTNLYNFSYSYGMQPHSGLVLSGNLLYGTTWSGGSSGYGTVFRMDTNGQSFATIYNFTGGADGGNPDGTLLSVGVTLYGTTTGLNDPSGYGTVFKVSRSGNGFTVLKYFAGGDGANPYGGLVLSGNTLYGTAQSGTPGLGTVYAVNTDGSGFTNLYSFTGGSDGAFPNAGLVLSGSELYGTTMGFMSCKDWNCYTSYGTVFKINTNGTGFTVLYTFANGAGSAGLHPCGALTLSGGILYGATADLSSANYGSVFKVSTNGSGFNLLHNFSGGSDGGAPYGKLFLSGSTLYGTTFTGGINGDGTVFALNLSIPLNASVAGGRMVLNWSDPTFSLQAAPTVTGPYQTVTNAATPYTNAMTSPQMFFRLQQ
jgi:uncharacterized repeat protein (TIGR03803 family)